MCFSHTHTCYTGSILLSIYAETRIFFSFCTKRIPRSINVEVYWFSKVPLNRNFKFLNVNDESRTLRAAFPTLKLSRTLLLSPNWESLCLERDLSRFIINKQRQSTLFNPRPNTTVMSSCKSVKGMQSTSQKNWLRAAEANVLCLKITLVILCIGGE